MGSKGVLPDSTLKLTQTDLAVRSLRVAIGGTPVGTLAQTAEGPIAFEYDASWLASGFSLSPFSLPLEGGLRVAKLHPFDGLFGVFDDSLPDGWGRLLVDRLLREHGIDPYMVSPLGRLAIVGRSGMGALDYEPELPLMTSLAQRTLDELARECAEMLKTDYTDDLDTLFLLGGSSGGARPKVFLPLDGEDWIVKFPSSHDPRDIGSSEYAIARAAMACGINMPEVRLMPSDHCSGYFAIKRFDRTQVADGIRRHHMVSAGGLLETSHRIPNLDYDLLMKLTLRLTDSLDEVEALYRLMVFNVVVGNRDDHAKNFTYLYRDGRWSLSPAYDLTQNSGMNGEHATTVGGKGRAIMFEDVVGVGVRAGMGAFRARSIAREIEETARGCLEGTMVLPGLSA